MRLCHGVGDFTSFKQFLCKATLSVARKDVDSGVVILLRELLPKDGFLAAPFLNLSFSS